MTEEHYFLINENGNIIYSEDDTRLKNAKRYQKILAFLFKRYRNRFIDKKPFVNNSKIIINDISD